MEMDSDGARVDQSEGGVGVGCNSHQLNLII